MSLTKEERAERKRKREEVLRLEKERLPEAFYAPRGIQIIFRSGEQWSFTVRTDNLALFRPCAIGGEAGWVEADVPLNDIESVAELAAALIARLNVMVTEANAHLLKCGAVKLEDPP